MALGLPAMPSIPSLNLGSSATSKAGDVGAFNFSPKAGNTAVMFIAAAIAIVFLFKR